MFHDGIQPRRMSEISMQSTISGFNDVPLSTINARELSPTIL